MSDPSKTSRRGPRVAPRWVLPVVAVVAAGLLLALGPLRNRILERFHVGYLERAYYLLAGGDPVGALEVIDRGSFVDPEGLAAVLRIRELNRAASFPSSTTGRLIRASAEEAELRFHVGEALLAQLEGESALDEAGRQLLERATNNAAILVALEPDSARAHYLLGTNQHLRGTRAGVSGALAIATSHLERAIAIDPRYSVRARQRARERARNAPGHRRP